MNMVSSGATPGRRLVLPERTARGQPDMDAGDALERRPGAILRQRKDVIRLVAG